MISKFLFLSHAAAGGISMLLISNSLKQSVFTKFNVYAEPWNYNWDGHKVQQPYHEGVERKLFFIRHGDYDKEDNSGLLAIGQIQAIAAGERLKELAKHYRITRIHSSFMPRAMQTMQIIRPYLKSRVPVEYSEIDYEGTPYYKDPLDGRIQKPVRHTFNEGARAEAAFRKFIRRPDIIGSPDQPPVSPDQQCLENAKKPAMEIYVGHSNIHRYYVFRALQLPLQAYLRFSNRWGGITELTVFTDGRVRCDTIGEYAFVQKLEHENPQARHY